MGSLHKMGVITPIIVVFTCHSIDGYLYHVPVGRPLRIFARRFCDGVVQDMVTAIGGLANESTA